MALPARIDRRVAIALGLLLAAGVVKGTVRLDEPRSIVFDEFHYARYVDAYCCKGERFFSYHPPGGSLPLAAFAVALGFDGDHPITRRTGSARYLRVNRSLWKLRILPATLAALLPLLGFGIVRRLGGSDGAGLLAAALIALDNAWTVQTRFVFIEYAVQLSAFGALLCALVARRLEGGRRLLALAACGALCGWAVATKLTGLWIYGLVCLLGVGRGPGRGRDGVSRAVAPVAAGLGVVTLAAAAVYTLLWTWHFAWLPEPGALDERLVPTGNPLRDTWAVTELLLRGNVALAEGHRYASDWWQWPVLGGAVGYWRGPGAGEAASGRGPAIHLFGNPVVWIASAAGIAAAAGLTVLRARDRLAGAAARIDWHVPVLGWAAAYLPFALITTRKLFVWSYLSPMVLGVLAASLLTDCAGGADEAGRRLRRRLRWSLAALALVGFLAVAPYTYGVGEGIGWLGRGIFGWRAVLDGL